jgi:hypothetical protein
MLSGSAIKENITGGISGRISACITSNKKALLDEAGLFVLSF